MPKTEAKYTGRELKLRAKARLVERARIVDLIRACAEDEDAAANKALRTMADVIEHGSTAAARSEAMRDLLEKPSYPDREMECFGCGKMITHRFTGDVVRGTPHFKPIDKHTCPEMNAIRAKWAKAFG